MTRYRNEGFETHGQPEGEVMTVGFELEYSKFVALNGGASSSEAGNSGRDVASAN